MEFYLERESIAYKLTRGSSGMQLHIRTCPACGDSRWRTYFGIETGRGNCFVCSAGYTKIKFIRDHLGLGEKEWAPALREAEIVLKEQGWRPRREAMAAVTPGLVVLPTSDALPLPDGSNLVYLESRGFNADICRYFGLRLCEFGWWKFTDEDGNTSTQEFSSRVIIPVFDLDGTLVTFQGRDLTNTSKSKYLFPMALPGTGRFLFNGQNALATEHIVMGEGAFDVAAIKMALDDDPGLRDIVAVGSFGKHLSYGQPDGNDQLARFGKLKQRGVRFVTIMWDGEPSAFTAALNAAKILTGIGLIARVAKLPAGKDPNEVSGDVVRSAFHAADVWTPAFDIRSRLRNPYAKLSRVG
jgi:DNA primase